MTQGEEIVMTKDELNVRMNLMYYSMWEDLCPTLY